MSEHTSARPMSTLAVSYTHLHPVDIAAMEKAAEYLMGTHDFSAFTDLKEDKDTVRTIYAVGIVYEKDTLWLLYTSSRQRWKCSASKLN